MSTLHRELCGIVSALQTYEHYIIGSPFPIYLYCDHKPILYLWGRKGQLSHRFFKYQVIITKFHNLKIIWTPGSNLAFPDILSRNVTLSEANRLQLQHNEIPHDISFDDHDGQQVHYTIKHEDEQNASYNDFYLIICQQGNTKKTLRLENDGNEHHVEDYLEDNEVLATMQDMTDCFKLEKTINQYKQLSSSLHERDYSDIEQCDEESTDGETDTAEFNFETDTILLCYREPIQDTCKTEMKICVSLSLFLPLFSLAHTHGHSGHPGILKTFENIRQYFFWPGRYNWIVYLIEDCIECQTIKTKRHDLHEAPLEQ